MKKNRFAALNSEESIYLVCTNSIRADWECDSAAFDRQLHIKLSNGE